MSEIVHKPPAPTTLRRFSLLIAFLVITLMVVLYRFDPALIRDIESQLIDARFNLRGEIPSSGHVAIVAIDDKSLDEIARWPWSRYLLADLIDEINQQGAAAIILDIVLSEPQNNQILADLQRNKSLDSATLNKVVAAFATQSPDQHLADVLAFYGNVVGGYYLSLMGTSATPIPLLDGSVPMVEKGAVAAVKTKLENYEAMGANGVVVNLPLFTDAFFSVGFFNTRPESDGVIREAPLFVRYGEALYPILAVQALSAAYGGEPVIVSVEDFGFSHFAIGGDEFTLDELGQITINYLGPEKTIPTYSATTLFDHSIGSGGLQDKIVFLGVPAIGIADRRPTPFDSFFPGVEIQATILENLLAGNALQKNNLAELLDLTTMILIVLLHALVLPRQRKVYARILFSLTIISIYLVSNFYFFAVHQLVINLVYPMLSWLLVVAIINGYLGVAVERAASNIRHAFKSYLHPGLVDQLVQNPEKLSFGGEERELSVLFSDIRNFTNLSEGITPTELARFLRCYMDPMTEQVLEHRGTLDKYIGDAVMAFYGAPYPSDLHARDACHSALGMIEKLDGIEQCCPDLGHLFPVKIGIGIHSDKVMVGNFGSTMRFNYTVLGDGVNLASRLEGMSKQYGVNIVVSESTKQRVEDEFIFRELDLVRVKGKEVPVRLFELVGRVSDEYDAVWQQLWEEALGHYHQQQWQQAKMGFEQALIQRGGEEKSCQLYLQRIESYQQTPPPADWDGVFTYTTK